MITWYAALLLLHLVLIIIGMAVNLRLPRVLPGDAPELPAAELPRVSVCVPARNEEAIIEGCVRSILRQTYPNLELVVVNDNSEDRTAEIITALCTEYPNLRLVQSPPLPAGWLGKNHALWQAQQQASGEYLLFVDADAQLDPRCVMATMKPMVDQRAPFLTLIPQIVTASFWEWVVQSTLISMMLGFIPAHKLDDPTDPEALCNGPYMLFRRDVYEAIGTHRAVRSHVVEDWALGQFLKQHGYPILYAIGPELQQVHMYHSLGEIWRGWSKNFFVGMKSSLALGLLVSLFLLGAFILPWLLLPVVVAGAVAGWWSIGGAALAVVGFPLARLAHRLCFRLMYRLDTNFWYLEWIGMTIIIGITWNSALVHLRGKPMQWKGRNVSGQA